MFKPNVFGCLPSSGLKKKKKKKKVPLKCKLPLSRETRLVSRETRLVSLETRLVSLETRLVSLETRLVSLETRLVSLETRLVSREKPSKNCKYHYKVSHSAAVRNRSAHRSVDLSRAVRVTG